MTTPTYQVVDPEAGAVPTVERFAKRYPDVPPEVILKEDLLRLGMSFTAEALAAARDCRHQAYFLFSYNISSHGEMGEGVSTAAPEDIRFHSGPYDLRPTWVRVVLNRDSPYVVDLVDGVPTIRERGIVVAQATYPAKPSYYGQTFRTARSTSR